MDAHAVRKLLKAARASLAEKQFDEALAKCKEVLQADRSCYEAFM
jgi:hypothetical protein